MKVLIYVDVPQSFDWSRSGYQDYPQIYPTVSPGALMPGCKRYKIEVDLPNPIVEERDKAVLIDRHSIEEVKS
jgi:hypothetical protein